MGGIAYVQKHEYEAMKAEIARLRAQRDELLAALKDVVEVMPDLPDYAESAFARRVKIARAAIAAVEDQHGEQIGGGPGG